VIGVKLCLILPKKKFLECFNTILSLDLSGTPFSPVTGAQFPRCTQLKGLLSTLF